MLLMSLTCLSLPANMDVKLLLLLDPIHFHLFRWRSRSSFDIPLCQDGTNCTLSESYQAEFRLPFCCKKCTSPFLPQSSSVNNVYCQLRLTSTGFARAKIPDKMKVLAKSILKILLNLLYEGIKVYKSYTTTTLKTNKTQSYKQFELRDHAK